jgi:hypothetical protein
LHHPYYYHYIHRDGGCNSEASRMQDCDEMTDKRGLGSTRRCRRRSGGGRWCIRGRRGPRRRSSRRTWRRREGRRRGARSTLILALDPNQKLRVLQPTRARNRKGTYLFWSSWRLQTKKEGWNLQDPGVLADGSYLSLQRRHTFSDTLDAAFPPPPDSIPACCCGEERRLRKC